MEPLSWPSVRFTFKSVGQRKRGKTSGICFHNADKCNVVTGTNFDSEFNQGVLNRLYHSTKHQHLLIKELDTKPCYCHPFGEDLWCLFGAFGEQCTQMTGEQLVSRQSAQVPCQTKSQAAEQITFSNRQLRHTSISFEKPIHFQNARVKMTIGHWPPYSCVLWSLFLSYQGSRNCGASSQTDFILNYFLRRKKRYFWYNNPMFRPCWSILGPIWSIFI